MPETANVATVRQERVLVSAAIPNDTRDKLLRFAANQQQQSLRRPKYNLIFHFHKKKNPQLQVLLVFRQNLFGISGQTEQFS